ncbi:MAG: hypothetical protein DRQ62_14145 [Gammaproteobacteria bacterium]|nr:MAG: hypothetical protein DRQ62_14145 [Gammaproteobacteria bacterium]
MYDFQSIMIGHGFTADQYDFESTIIGFDHDIHFSLFDNNSIFNINRSRTYRQWSNFNALLHVDLVTRNCDIEAAVCFVQQRWLTELRYQNAVREIIDLHQSSLFASIHVLTISRCNVMTILFNIEKRGGYEYI